MRGRGDRLEAVLAERELDRLLITDLTNVRYLTGFTGSNGAVVCGPGVRLFFTDFRYTELAAAQVEGWEPITVDLDWLGEIAGALEGRVGFEDDHMSVRALSKLEEKLPDGVVAVAAGGAVEGLRRIKDDEELAAIAAASELGDAVWTWIIEQGMAGRTEAEVAFAAEGRMREHGGEPAFETIVASGPNGALPHAVPGERAIAAGDLVVFDMGVKLDGYCSDGTRTWAIGAESALSDEARTVHEVVRAAQAAALAAIRPGVKGVEVDEIARKVIDDAGYGERFGHGLGHGVGLEVHEAPRLSRGSDDVLAAGEVLTDEPGIYLPGELGVRIEDLVAVTADGYRNFSSLPKELTFVD